MANEMDRVVPLGQLDDFKVADGDPDVRGWQVVGADGQKIGEVDELLIDTNAMKVRYLDVEVENGLMAEPDRHVLVPIGYARLDRDSDRVMVDNLASTDLRSMPAYDQAAVTRDYETTLRDSFSRGPATTDSTVLAGGSAVAGGSPTSDSITHDPDFYAHHSFDDNRFYGRGTTGESTTFSGRDMLDDTTRSMGGTVGSGSGRMDDGTVGGGSGYSAGGTVGSGAGYTDGGTLGGGGGRTGDTGTMGGGYAADGGPISSGGRTGDTGTMGAGGSVIGSGNRTGDDGVGGYTAGGTNLGSGLGNGLTENPGTGTGNDSMGLNNSSTRRDGGNL